MDRSTKQKISKETQTLNNAMGQLDLIDIYRTFHPKTKNFIFLNAYRTFSRIDHILGHKSSLGKFLKIEIISRIFSDHNAVRLIVNYQKKKKKNYYKFKHAATAAKSLQSCPTLCDPIDSSPPGSPVPGILQARTLEWVAISFSNAGK